MRSHESNIMEGKPGRAGHSLEVSRAGNRWISSILPSSESKTIRVWSQFRKLVGGKTLAFESPAFLGG